MSRPPAGWRNFAFVAIAAAVVVLDQASKAWIRNNLEPGHSLFDLGFFRIINIGNTGAAFGIFPDKSVVLTVFAIIGIVAIVLCALFTHRCFHFLDNLAGKAALGLILGGTAGNLIDRLRIGYITDFIDFKVWPAFNVADSAITIGIVVFAYLILRQSRRDEG